MFAEIIKGAMISKYVIHCSVLFTCFRNMQSVMLALNALLGNCSSMLVDNNKSEVATTNQNKKVQLVIDYAIEFSCNIIRDVKC